MGTAESALLHHSPLAKGNGRTCQRRCSSTATSRMSNLGKSWVELYLLGSGSGRGGSFCVGPNLPRANPPDDSKPGRDPRRVLHPAGQPDRAGQSIPDPIASPSPRSPSTLLPWPDLARPHGHATPLLPDTHMACDTKDVLYAGESLLFHPAQTLQAFDNVL